MEKGLSKSKNAKFWRLLVISVWQISKIYLNKTFLCLKYYLILAGTPLNSKVKIALVIKLFFLVFVISRIYFCHMVCKHPALHPMLHFLSKPVLLYPFTLKQQVLLLSIKKCKFVSNVCIFHFDILFDRDNHIFMETYLPYKQQRFLFWGPGHVVFKYPLKDM